MLFCIQREYMYLDILHVVYTYPIHSLTLTHSLYVTHSLIHHVTHSLTHSLKAMAPRRGSSARISS